MDTSETYIKMRLAAIPDLGMGTPPNLPLGNDGPAWVDYCVFIDRHGNYYYSRINMQPIGEVVLSTTMLERQDQLQEMLGDCNNPYPIIESFVDYALSCKRLDGSEWIFTSMEQLWLAFVMAEKYNKIWDGEKWVNN